MQEQVKQQQHVQAAQAAQMSGQEPPPPPEPDPAVQEMLALPTWEEITQVLQSDLFREFRIDVETDSTIQNEQAQDEERITKLLTGLMNFMDGMAPAVQAGVLPMGAAKEILKVSLRRFKFGRELEDAIDSMGQEEQQPDPVAEAEQAQMQMDMELKQLDMQMKELEMQGKQREDQAAMQREAMEAEVSRMEHQQKMEELHLKRVAMMEAHEQKMSQIRAQGNGQ
jgi:hypothetical protein